MRCPSCGSDYPATTRFCPTDGAPLVADAGPGAPTPSAARPFLLGLLSALAVAVLVFVAFRLGATSTTGPAAPVLSQAGEPFGMPATASPGGVQAVVQSPESVASEAAARAERAAERSAAAAERMARDRAAYDVYEEGDAYPGDAYLPSGTMIMAGLFDVPTNARRRADLLIRAGFQPNASPEEAYRGYQEGGTLVTLGPYTRAEARRALASVRRVVPDAFVKDLSLR